MGEIDNKQTPTEKMEEIERREGKETRFTFMVNVTNIINWFKKWRKSKNGKVIQDDIDKSINDAINRCK